MAKAKYYDVEHAVKMLPLVKAYCRDLRDTFSEAETLVAEHKKLAGMTALSKPDREDLRRQRDKVRERIEAINRYYARWRDELAEIHLVSCSAKLGRVDIPIYCDILKSVVLLCVSPESIEDDLEWHEIGKDVESAKPYYDRSYLML